MTLDPLSYACPEHHVDLTTLVTQSLDDDGPPVAYPGLPAGKLGLRARVPGPRPFEVLVTCPGRGGAGAHRLTCSGMWTR